MTYDNRIKVAILGYGHIARNHRIGYELLKSQMAPVELVALCDIDPEQFQDMEIINSDESTAGVRKDYHTYTDLEEMLKQEEVDVIDICLPTYLHCEYTVKLLKRGYHVMCEKPMGRNTAECARMLAAEKESGKKLMIGMCLRFNPMYLELKKLIDEKTYGEVTSAHFERRSAIPAWGYQNWFQNYECSGGAALDFHIHDVDMIRFLFGEPKAVSAVAANNKIKCTTIHSTFIYDDKAVTAIGDWGAIRGAKMGAVYRVNFERATVISENREVFVYPEGTEGFKLELDKGNHMAEEALFFAKTIMGEIENEKNLPADSAGTVRLVEKLVESAEHDGRQIEI